MSLSLTEANIMQTLGNFFTAILPDVEIRRGQENRTTLPSGPNWLVMTPILRTRLDTNTDIFSVTDTVGITAAGTTIRLDVQADCYGPAAEDNAQIISTLFRDEYATAFFFHSGFAVSPLYTFEPRNLTFINDAAQYEPRWNVDVSLEINPVVTFPQQYMDAVGPVTIISVDEKYPPTGAS
jgi:hypothetical protein